MSSNNDLQFFFENFGKIVCWRPLFRGSVLPSMRNPRSLLIIVVVLLAFFFFKKIFVGHMSICRATDTPVSDFW